MKNEKPSPKAKKDEKDIATSKTPLEKEINGFEDSGLPEPTRFGDWEVKGRCSDF